MDFSERVELGFVCERAERRKAQNRAAQRKFRGKKSSSNGSAISPPSMGRAHPAQLEQGASAYPHDTDLGSWLASSTEPTRRSPQATAGTHTDVSQSLPLSTFSRPSTASARVDACPWPDPEPSNISDMANVHLLGLATPYTISPNPTPRSWPELQVPQGSASWPPQPNAATTPLILDTGETPLYSPHEDRATRHSRGFTSAPGCIAPSGSGSASKLSSRAPSEYMTGSELSPWNPPHPPPNEHHYSAGPGSCSSGSGDRPSPSLSISGSSSSDWNLPLHIAAEKGHESIVKTLVESGVDVNERDSAGCTALHIAVRYKQEGLLKILVENGADVNAQDASGWTPVHTAADNGFSAALRLLLEYGGSLTLKARKKR